MDATDGPPVIKLGEQDEIAGLALSTEAHWNQTEEDWRIFLRDGVVFGIRDGARLVATAALLPYSGNNAWISMVLVSGTHRRRGLATRLVDACMETARKSGLTSWLDATPDGAKVYGPLGFTPTLQLRRLKLVNPAPSSAPAPSAATIEALCALLIDAVASQSQFLDGLTASGWTIERPFQRMRFGPATHAAKETPFAVAGPEFG